MGDRPEEQLNSEALQRQDPIEFERLYITFSPALRLYLARLCGNREMANDLLQETFVKAYRALLRTGPDLQVRPWLYKIATNTARSATRLAQWKRVLTFSDYSPDRHQLSNATFETRFEEAELVERALAAIKPDYAAPLLYLRLPRRSDYTSGNRSG